MAPIKTVLKTEHWHSHSFPLLPWWHRPFHRMALFVLQSHHARHKEGTTVKHFGSVIW